MRTWSLFPKFYRDASLAELAAAVRAAGLDAVNAVVRKGYWVTRERLADELPAFVRAMEAEGLSVPFATAGLTRADIEADDRLLGTIADCGIPAFRLAGFAQDADVRGALDAARRDFAFIAERAARRGLRAVLQVHHGSLVPNAAAAHLLVRDLDPAAAGIMLDPGNQSFEGFERWGWSVPLLGEHLAAVGVKDSAPVRDPDQAATPWKGWRRNWAALSEGVTDWFDLVRVLRTHRFTGPLVFMPFYGEGMPMDEAAARTTALVREDVAYLRRVVEAVEREEAGKS